MLAHALLVAASLLPLAAMLAALFAAIWIHEGRREAEAARASASRRH
ncbi:MAG: hypothetical protein ACJ74I_04725 [Gaiellaceae bacterium]